jgi:glycosyltransferase involved in cell wall biosynthesis
MRNPPIPPILGGASPAILADGRWIGPHGIGRFASNVLARLPQHAQLRSGPRRLSLLDPLWLSYQIGLHRPDIFFSPAFSLPAVSLSPIVFTVHDLIWLELPASSLASTCLRKLYFHAFVKRAAKRAYRVLTVSEYSRRRLLEWTGLRDDAVVNVGNGIDPIFDPSGPRYNPGFPYILYVGNFKSHKNITRLFQAFSDIAYPRLRLLLTGSETPALRASLQSLKLEQRVRFTGYVTDHRLAELYRGALALVQPSLSEGFGLPPLEALACGTPAVVSCVAALPEVMGDAAVFVDPLDVTDIRRGVERVIGELDLRRKLIAKGRLRASLFSWDDVAARVARVLGVSCASMILTPSPRAANSR